MSYLSDRQIRFGEWGLDHVIEANVCSKHFEDEAIGRIIKKRGEKERCTYCNKIRIVLSLEELLVVLMNRIKLFYDDAAQWMIYETAEGGYQGETYYKEEVVDEVFRLDNDQLRDDIISSIADWAWSKPINRFDDETDYISMWWHEFKKIVKYESRYLIAKKNLFKSSSSRDAFDVFDEIAKRSQYLRLFTKISEGTKLYRCRQHKSSESISSADQMVSPPNQNAIYPNRMSPSGISMFYCAFDQNTAIRETIDPSLKDRKKFSITTFQNKRDLKVLDFTRLPTLPSMFDDKGMKSYAAVAVLIDFVRDLSAEIKRDGKEHIDYVPTQIMTEYFRYYYSQRKKSPIEGIIYPSSKNRKEKVCVLFFNHEESLKEMKFNPSSLRTSSVSKAMHLLAPMPFRAPF